MRYLYYKIPEKFVSCSKYLALSRFVEEHLSEAVEANSSDRVQLIY